MKPTMVFDGDCGFCRKWIERWRTLTSDSVEYVSFQSDRSRFPEVSEDSFREAVHVKTPEGTWLKGSEAVFYTLRTSGKLKGLYFLYRYLPGFAPLSEICYRFVARHRKALSPVSDLFMGRTQAAQSFDLSRWIFMRGLGFVFLAAFFSLNVQLEGLWGPKGILSASDFLSRIYDYAGPRVIWQLPTLFWFKASPFVMHGVCYAAMLAAVLLIAGILPGVMLFLLWAAYLSFVTIGRDFLSFQWDVLLLEVSFQAFFLVPFFRHDSPECKTHRGFLFLMKWLLFRLMFSSGFVKLASGDLSWRSLSALRFHYETQPLPAWTSWYAHNLPDWFHTFSALTMFGIELILPFFIFGPRFMRLFAASAFIFLQAMIMATGNYGFFNILTIFLCLFLVDDEAWSKFRKPDTRSVARKAQKRLRGDDRPLGLLKQVQKFVTAVIAVFLFALTLYPFAGTLGARNLIPSSVKEWHRWTSPYHLTSGYGLFAVMTTRRPEIVIEGSMDGKVWRAYDYKYKPDDLTQSPRFVMPHQPRLDWQLWFAALGSYENQPWFVNLCVRLLQGSKPVEALFKQSAFTDGPPIFIRARRAVYQFTSPEEKRRTGRYWKMGTAEIYMPTMSLRNNV